MKLINVFVLFCLLIINVQGRCQQNTGIKWMERVSWEQILQKAKTENKYIFVDCYTTWCGPCKAMEKNVYPDTKVGDIMNDKFLSVKAQMDRTNKDDNNIKAWYNDAKKIETDFKIEAFPTLLFFSPDGRLVHRVSQGLNVEGFIDVASAAVDPEKQYYTNLENYKRGQLEGINLKDLAKSAKGVGDDKLALKIAEDYMAKLKPKDLVDEQIRDFVIEFHQAPNSKPIASGFIKDLNKSEIYEESKIRLIRQFTQESTDIGFKIFYNNPVKINKIMDAIKLPPGLYSFVANGDYAQSVVRNVIFSEEIYMPFLKPALDSKAIDNCPDPDWPKVQTKIRKKYPKANVERIIIDAQVIWFNWKRNWKEYSKSLIRQMDMVYSGKNLAGNSFFINNNCWEIFKRATDTAQLNRALYWMEEMFKQNEKDKEWYTAQDTYANLLYKVGRTSEALYWQERALKNSGYRSLEIKSAWEKMNKGQPTWPQ